MADFATQSDLVVQQVRDASDLAGQAYLQAREALDTLAASSEALNLTVVDTSIGDNAGINWTVDVIPPANPIEPDYETGAPTAPTIPDITTPAPITVDTLPDWDADLSGTPTAMPALSLSAVATLNTLPEISTIVPVIDVALLDTDFSFTEPVYVERVSTEVEAGVKRVLGGDLGLPVAYWDALWAQSAGDLARQQVGRLRNARNRGAASYWPLPSETVLAASREIQDEGARSLQINRLQQAVAQATMAREDFWNAISQGIAYENQWIAASQQAAGRALAAAEQLTAVKIQVHNANIQRYNSLIEAAKTDGSLSDLRVKRILEQQRAELEENAMEIEQDKQTVSRYQATWQGWQIDTQAQITNLAEQVKRWNSQTDAHARYQALDQQKAQLDLSSYTAQLGAIDSIARATSAVLSARTGAADFDLRAQLGDFSTDTAKNNVELERTKITQAAQEAAARIDVAQAQWINGQGLSIQQRIAELAFGYAQAAVAAADVGLSSSVGISLSGAA